MKDPVCGMDVDAASAAGSSVYHSQEYYFCSTGCKTAFDVDPERYVGHTAQSAHGSHGQVSACSP